MERQQPPTGGELQGTREQAASREERHHEDERARTELMERISAAGVTTLGKVATVVTAEQAADDTDADNLPWTDAARWSPAQVARTENESDEQDRLDALFGEIPDEEIGTIEDMSWFGLLRNEGRPGGIILSQNQYGFRGIWEVDSDDRLARHWNELQREYDSFMEATHAHNREPSEHDDREHEATNRDHHPEIWVGSLSDYNNGRLHGAWLDATLDPSELRDAIQFMLRGSYVPGAEEWAIMDYDDFCGVRSRNKISYSFRDVMV